MGFQDIVINYDSKVGKKYMNYMMDLAYIRILSKIKYVYDTTNVRIPLVPYVSIINSTITYELREENEEPPYISSNSDFFTIMIIC